MNDVRLNVILSDELNQEIEVAAKQSSSTKSEILRKALQLFLAARQGKQEGKKLILVNPQNEAEKTEFVGL